MAELKDNEIKVTVELGADIRKEMEVVYKDEDIDFTCKQAAMLAISHISDVYGKRHEASVSGAMRWPWSQEAAIHSNFEVIFK